MCDITIATDTAKAIYVILVLVFLQYNLTARRDKLMLCGDDLSRVDGLIN